MIQIDGIFYHFERIRKEILMSEYKVDGDPDYERQTDAEGSAISSHRFARNKDLR